MKNKLLFLLFLSVFTSLRAEDGYQLWLRYAPLTDAQNLEAYRGVIRYWMVDNGTPTAEVVRRELRSGLEGLLGHPVQEVKNIQGDGMVIVTTFDSPLLSRTGTRFTQTPGDEGYVMLSLRLAGKKGNGHCRQNRTRNVVRRLSFPSASADGAVH